MEHVKNSPDSIAVIDRAPLLARAEEDSSITYFSLNKKADQIAAALSEKGIKRNDLVGILGEKIY